MATNLRGKRVLITAGPTWVPIDKVRVISNTATGRTGILLANKLAQQGAKVTLLLGSLNSCCLNRNIKLVPFKFFDELNLLLKRELKSRHYDIIIHSAAVSDYKPSIFRKKKLSSGHKSLKLTLKPTPKIIDSLRKISPRSFLVGFKFEPDLATSKLIKKARQLIQRAKLNLAVGNSACDKSYIAYLVSANKNYGPFLSKEKMIKGLIGLI